MRLHRRLRWTVLLAAGAVAVGAVALAGLTDDDPPVRSGTGTTVTVPDRPGPLVDWARPVPVDLGDGWAVADTEGDGPFLTVLRHGRTVGFVEYLDFPLEGPAADERAALDAHVADFVQAIGEDRSGVPISGYRFDPDPAVHLPAADGSLVRYGFRGTYPDGRPSERTIQWAGIRGGRLVLVAAAANDPGGLFPPEGVEFTSADLDAVAERLDRLVRASGLPDPAR